MNYHLNTTDEMPAWLKKDFLEEQYHRGNRRDIEGWNGRETEGEIADRRRAAGFYLLGDCRDIRNLRAIGKSAEELWIVKENNFDGYYGLTDEEPDHDEARIFDCPQAAVKAAEKYWGKGQGYDEPHYEVMPVSKALQLPGDIDWPGNT